MDFLHSCQGLHHSPKSFPDSHFPQPRRCQHHRQQSGGASERSARPPWLCCSRRADWEAAALKVHSDWATYCWGLGRWKQFCSALFRLNCDFCSFDIFWTAGNHYQQTLSIGWSYLQAAIMLSCAQHFNCFFLSERLEITYHSHVLHLSVKPTPKCNIFQVITSDGGLASHLPCSCPSTEILVLMLALPLISLAVFLVVLLFVFLSLLCRPSAKRTVREGLPEEKLSKSWHCQKKRGGGLTHAKIFWCIWQSTPQLWPEWSLNLDFLRATPP